MFPKGQIQKAIFKLIINNNDINNEFSFYKTFEYVH